VYNGQVNQWLLAGYFCNLPLCIINSYYPKFSDSLLGSQFFDIDIDNFSGSQLIFKTNLPSSY
jgi:hypothetical protein